MLLLGTTAAYFAAPHSCNHDAPAASTDPESSIETAGSSQKRSDYPNLQAPDSPSSGALAAPIPHNPEVRYWIDQGYLPAIRIGRRVRIKRSDFDALMDASYTGTRQLPVGVWDGDVPAPVVPGEDHEP